MLEASDIGLQPFPQLRDAWSKTSQGGRLEALGSQGRALHDDLRRGPKVASFRAVNLVLLPYPTAYGLAGGSWLPFPYLWMQHRMLIVRFKDSKGQRTLLFNPTDHDRARHTPFFWSLSQRYGEFISNRVMSRVQRTFLDGLRLCGVRPEEIDYVAYDHCHTQDIRRHAGTTRPVPDLGPEPLAPLLPNARFLIQRREWATWVDPHPLQRAWYVPGAIDGLDSSRVVMLDGDYHLGEGLYLIATPGHTMGNHSLVAATASANYVISENGVSADCYSPRESGIPGLRRYAEERGIDLVPNSNTLESALQQYESMTLEKAIAGPASDPRFCNVFPSSELTPHPFAPGISPAFRHGEVQA